MVYQNAHKGKIRYVIPPTLAERRREITLLPGRIAFQTLLKGKQVYVRLYNRQIENLRRREASGNDGVADRLSLN